MMKKMKTKIFNSFLLLIMIAYFAVQGLHSWHHLNHFFHEKSCHHSFKTAKHQITHQHEKFENCNVCHFSLDSFINQNSFGVLNKIEKTNFKKLFFFAQNRNFQYFFGTKSLRAPPFFN